MNGQRTPQVKYTHYYSYIEWLRVSLSKNGHYVFFITWWQSDPENLVGFRKSSRCGGTWYIAWFQEEKLFIYFIFYPEKVSKAGKRKCEMGIGLEKK